MKSRPTLSRLLPWAFFTFQVLVLFAWYEAGGVHDEVIHTPDTTSYEMVDLGSVRSMLESQRTLAYPILLAAFERVSPNLSILPYVNFFTWAGAIGLFALGLQTFLGSAWRGVVIASGMLYAGNFYLRFTPWMLPEILAAAFGIATIGMLLFVLAKPRSFFAWMTLALMLALSYHTRPVYLFLIPLVPFLGGMILLLFPGTSRGASKLRTLALLVLVAVGPLLAYNTLRWQVVDHFGLVSLGGMQASGVSCQWLDEPTIEKISPELQPLAKRIVQYREVMPRWRAPRNYRVTTEMFLDTIVKIAFPAALSFYDDSLDYDSCFSGTPKLACVRANQDLGALAKEIQSIHRVRYLRWVYNTINVNLNSVLQYFITERVVQWMVLLLVAVHLLFLALHRKQSLHSKDSLHSTENRTSLDLRPFGITLICATGYAMAQIVVLSLVVVSIKRYYLATGIFLPALCTAALVVYGDAILRRVRSA